VSVLNNPPPNTGIVAPFVRAIPPPDVRATGPSFGGGNANGAYYPPSGQAVPIQWLVRVTWETEREREREDRVSGRGGGRKGWRVGLRRERNYERCWDVLLWISERMSSSHLLDVGENNSAYNCPAGLTPHAWVCMNKASACRVTLVFSAWIPLLGKE
jgi:hypothetical protein